MLDPAAPLNVRRADMVARSSPQIEPFRAPAGPVRLPAAVDHRLRMHTGAPVRGVCGGHAFVSSRGHLDLVPAGMTDEWCGEAQADSLVLTLPNALIERAAAEVGRPGRALEARCFFRDARIEHIVWALEAEQASGSDEGLLYAESLGLALAFHLLGSYANPTSPSRAGRVFSSAERKRVTEHIESQLGQNLSLVSLADTVGMSASHFKTIFRRSLGVPVHEYVIQRRVIRARALLLDGRLPGAEVALAAGFAHQSHMARCMRRVLGVTPSAFSRAKHDLAFGAGEGSARSRL
jgi:AraC family transcriptional regulator